VNNDTTQHTVKGPGFAKDGGNALPPGHPPIVHPAGIATNSGEFALWSALLLLMVAPFGWARMRKRRRVA
jgi:hypothetical protein